MADTTAVLGALKRALKSRGLTYRDVARTLDLSEASVKRLFSQRDFTLERIERVCTLMDLSLGDLVRLADADRPQVTQLSESQERELVGDRKLLLVAVLAQNGWKFEEILARYDFTEPALIQQLARLDRLRIIDLLPRNRIHLRVSRNLAWRRNGPIDQLFRGQVLGEFLEGDFDRPTESMQFVFGVLSVRSNAIIQHRLEQVMLEFNALHQEDMKLPLDERDGTSMLLATRRWELAAFKELRRERTPRG